MPFIYGVTPGTDLTTNATPGTENDSLFLKPGAGRAMFVQAFTLVGKAAGLTAISGIVARIKQWTSTSSSGGTGITPASRDPGMQAAKATAGYATSAVTPGTGGPKLHQIIGTGAGNGNGWVAPSPDSAIVVEASATQSVDAFVSSGTASMKYELSAEIGE